MIDEKGKSLVGSETGSSIASVCRSDMDLLPWGSFGTLMVREFKASLLKGEKVVAEAKRTEKIPEKFEIENFDESSDVNVIYLEQGLFFPTRNNGWIRIDKDVTRDELVSITTKYGYDKFRGIVFVSVSHRDIAGENKVDINRTIKYYDLYPYLQ